MNYPLASGKDVGAYADAIDWKGKIIWMSPQKFLSLVRPLKAEWVNHDSMKNIEQRLTNNLPIDPLVLEVDMSSRKIIGHEGRHRAIKCIELGIKSVPVLVVTGSMYPRTPKWTPEQHKDVEDVINFIPENSLPSFKEFFRNIIQEMLQRPSDDGDVIIAHNGNYWRVDYDTTSATILNDIKSHTGLEGDNVHEIISDASDNRPDIFVGQIRGDYLYSMSYNEFSHGPDSPLIHKLLKHLNLSLFQQSDLEDQEGETSYIKSRKEVDADIEYAYHGTCLSALKGILKYGLMPSEENSSNWNFSFSDRIFLSTKQDYAIFHANNSARKQHSRPIIIKIKLPDTSKIVPDFDVADIYGMAELSDREGYSAHTRHDGYKIKNRKQINTFSPKINPTRNSGVFAYKGRIPASFIVWIGYSNDDSSELTRDDMNTLTELNDAQDFIYKMNEYGFYDPSYYYDGDDE